MNDLSTMQIDELFKRFADIVGEKNALVEVDQIAPFINEPRGLYAGISHLVLKPSTTLEVSEIVKLANETKTPIVPQGGNTGLVGGQMPDKSGRAIVVSLSRMTKIREIDVASSTMTVEAGTILQNIQNLADDVDLLFPLSLASEGTCQIGGNLSSNAGGTTAVAYGNARELCYGVEVVLPNGEIFDDLRKLKKDNTGYDLKNLIIGAEGTLGIITAAVLKLVPKPKSKVASWVGLQSPDHALRLLQCAQDRAGSALTTFELIHDRPLQWALKHIAGNVAPLEGEHKWHVLMEISSTRDAQDAQALAEDILGAMLEAETIEDATIGASIAQSEALWRLRETMPESQKYEGDSIKHDISVPIAAVPEFIERADKVIHSISQDARIVCFGHMGDGNMHYNISEPKDGDPNFLDLYKTMNGGVHAIVRDLNGSISAEHGIGQMKRDELLATAPKAGINAMRAIKQALDPNNIMNPGKVI